MPSIWYSARLAVFALLNSALTKVGGGVQHASVYLPGNASFFWQPLSYLLISCISEAVTPYLALSFMPFSYDNRHPSGVTRKFSWRQHGSVVRVRTLESACVGMNLSFANCQVEITPHGIVRKIKWVNIIGKHIIGNSAWYMVSDYINVG